MTDSQVLFLAIILLYISECLFWVDSLGIACIQSYKNWRVAVPSAFFGTAKGGLALAWPFPFLGRVHLAYVLPVSFSPEGIVNTTLERAGTRTASASIGGSTRALYKDIASVGHEGKQLLINGKIFCACGSSHQAAAVVRMVRDITGGKTAPGRIEKHFQALFDSARLETGREDLLRQTKFLAVCCNVQWVMFFVVCPALVLAIGSAALIVSALYIFLSNIALVSLYHQVHRKVYTGGREGHSGDIAKMLLSPPLAIRAQDLLSLQFAVDFHPVAVAYHLLDRQHFLPFAKQLLLSYNPSPDVLDGVDHKDDVLSHLKSLEQAVKVFLVANGISPAELVRPPAPAAGIASYCPRCHAQYVQKHGQCGDCGGVDLITYGGNDSG